jgi:TonB family protein
MQFPGKNLLKRFVERDPKNPKSNGRVDGRVGGRGDITVGSSSQPVSPTLGKKEQFALWHDVFVEQDLPWSRFLQSAAIHLAAVALIWTISLSWIRQQKILDRATFDRSSLVTYTPQEYLPPLNTGATKMPKVQTGDPAYAKQAILSVPREADNRSQTIVVPPDLKLNHDVPLPNMVATGAVAPMVPLDATQSRLSHVAAPDTQVVAPAPEVQFARDRVVQSSLKSDIIAPPPELTQSTNGHVGLMNIGPSQVVAPAPQLALAEQHTAMRGTGRRPGESLQPVGPPPSVAAGGNNGASGRMIALGIHPVAPSGPVAVPGGNRRGALAANPHGKPGASGTPDFTANSNDKDGGFKTRGNGSLPAGLHVGAAGSGDGREVASLSSPKTKSGARAASLMAEDKITDMDRKVFGGKRVYGRTLNMPNLNSSTGSWVIKFAELDGGHKDGELLEPVATEKPDPGYPLELMRANVHGVVTLYAVIHSDGRVSDIRVMNSPDDRLDSYAAKALSGWKFVPAERAGKAVALEAVVEIPFRVRRDF